MTIKFNYTIFVPDYIPCVPNPLRELQDKVARVPVQSSDKLHPAKDTPYVEYVDEGLWRSRIEFKKDYSYRVLLSQIQGIQGKTYESLDHLCEAEVQRRFPNYQLITGLKALLKNKFPNLARFVMGTDAFNHELTQKEVNKYKIQVAYSAINRDDLICKPKIEDATLRQQLHLTQDEILQTEHIFAKNSPLNGQSFMHKGNPVRLSQAIACSSDRKVENTGNLRVVQTKDKQSICYTGRVDSDRKVLEQASFIFFNELKSNRKGVTQTTDASGNTVYQLDYAINSMLSIPFFWNTESPLAPFPERQYLENEREALLALQAKAVTIEDPNLPGVKYQVKFNPILFTRSANIFTRMENWLPPFFTGHGRSEEISADGLASLKALAQQKIGAIHDPEKVKRIQSCLAALEQNLIRRDLTPEVEWLTRDYLCKLLELPMVYHCKSSTDRTSITIAISSTLQQWIALKLPLLDLSLLFQDLRFKELFAANWTTGHQITRYARGAKGTVAGVKLNNKNLGLALSRGIAQNPLIATLLPERYLRDFPIAKKVKYTVAYLALVPLVLPLIYIWMIFVAAIRLIVGADHAGKGISDKFFFPRLPWTLLYNFHRMIPNQELNEASPQVGGRLLIAGGKNRGKDDNEH